MRYCVREFTGADTEAVNVLALAAFAQYSGAYSDWSAFSKSISSMASLAKDGEIIVADSERGIIGAVAYIGPHKPKSAIFEPSWPIMRMLVVTPSARGFGVGRALAEECIARARRDQAPLFALHTSSIMQIALPMYEHMGFTFLRAAPAIFGVPYGIYVKHLST
jgi:GNAT superfamily N-acetyltransferase